VITKPAMNTIKKVVNLKNNMISMRGSFIKKNRILLIIFGFCNIINFAYSDTIPIWIVKHNDSIIIQSNLSEFYRSTTYKTYSSFTKEEINNLLKDTTIWHFEDSNIVFNLNFLQDTSTEYYKHCRKDDLINDSINKNSRPIYKLDDITYVIQKNNKKGVIKIFFYKNEDVGDDNKVLYLDSTTREIELQNDTGLVLYKRKYRYKAGEYSKRCIKIKIAKLIPFQRKMNISSFIIFYSENCNNCINDKIVLGRIILE